MAIYAALDKTLAKELSKVGRRCDAFVAKIVPKGKFDLRMFEDNFVMLRWDEYLEEKEKEEMEMIGWYWSRESVQKENLTVLRSYMGVVLYERNYYSKHPFVLFKKGEPIAEISDKTLAEKAFHAQFESKKVFVPLRSTVA